MDSFHRRSVSEDNIKMKNCKFSFSDMATIPEDDTVVVHNELRDNSFSLDDATSDETISTHNYHHTRHKESSLCKSLSTTKKSVSPSCSSPCSTASTAPSTPDDLYDELSSRARSVSSLEPRYLPSIPTREHSGSYSFSPSSSSPGHNLSRSLSARVGSTGRSRCSSEDSLELVIHYDRCKSLNLVDHSEFKHSKWGECILDNVQVDTCDIDMDIFGGSNLFPITSWISQAFSKAGALLNSTPTCPRRKTFSPCKRRRRTHSA